MAATISAVAGAAAGSCTISHPAGGGLSTISFANGALTIANSVTTGTAVSSFVVPNRVIPLVLGAFTSTSLTGGFGFTQTALGVAIIPIGTQIVASGNNTGVTITGYTNPTTYMVSASAGGTLTLVNLDGTAIAVSANTGALAQTFSLAPSTGLALTATSIGIGGVVTGYTGTALAAGTFVVLTGTVAGGSIANYTTGDTYMVAAGATATSFTLTELNGAGLTVTLTAPATSITGLTYTAQIGIVPFRSVTFTNTGGGCSFNYSATQTNTVIYAVGTAIVVTGTPTGTGTIAGYTSGTTYLVSASTAGNFTLTTLAGVAIVTTAGLATGLTFTQGGSMGCVAGTAGANTLLTAVAARVNTLQPVTTTHTFQWQVANTANVGVYTNVAGNLTGNTELLQRTAALAVGNSGLYRCLITPTGTGVSTAVATASAPTFISFT